MATVVVSGLAPGTVYTVQARAILPDGPSGWSRTYSFITVFDDVPPPPVENLKTNWDTPTEKQAIDPPKDCVVSWDPPNPAPSDLDHYEITVAATEIQVEGDAPLAWPFNTVDTQFTFTFEQNQNLFGTPLPQLDITVKAVDKIGNKSEPVTIRAINPPPTEEVVLLVPALNGGQDIEYPKVTPITLGYSIEFTPASFSDYGGTYFYEDSSEGSLGDFAPANDVNLVATALSSPVTIHPSVNPFNQRWVKTAHADVFGQGGPVTLLQPVTPINPVTLDTTPPPDVTGFDATVRINVDETGVTPDYYVVDFIWNPVLDPDRPEGDNTTLYESLGGYSIKYRVIGTELWTVVSLPKDVTSVTINDFERGLSYEAEIRAFSIQQNYSLIPYTIPLIEIGINNAIPDPVTGLTVYAGPTFITATWDASDFYNVKDNRGYYKVEVWSNDFDAENITPYTTISSSTSATIGGLSAEETYYVRVKVVTENGIESLVWTEYPLGITTSKTIEPDHLLEGFTLSNQQIQVGDSPTSIILQTKPFDGIDYSRFYIGPSDLGWTDSSIFYKSAGIPFYADSTGKFSLGSKLYWDPSTSSLTIAGEIQASSGHFTGAVTLDGPTGTMKIGYAAGGIGQHGLYVNSDTYIYSSGNFSVGKTTAGVFSGIKWNGTTFSISGAVKIQGGSTFEGNVGIINNDTGIYIGASPTALPRVILNNKGIFGIDSGDNNYFVLTNQGTSIIGGWVFTKDGLSAGSGSSTVGLMANPQSQNVSIYAGGVVPATLGTSNAGEAKFYITNAGKLYAHGAYIVGNGTFTGALSAATGTFAGSLSAASGTFTGQINAGGVLLGKDAGGTNLHGLKIDANNYFYLYPGGTLSRFRVGSSTRYLLWDGANTRIEGDIFAWGGQFKGYIDVMDLDGTRKAMTLGYITNGINPMRQVQEDFVGLVLKGWEVGSSKYDFNGYVRNESGDIGFRVGNYDNYIEYDSNPLNQPGVPRFEVKGKFLAGTSPAAPNYATFMVDTNGGLKMWNNSGQETFVMSPTGKSITFGDKTALMYGQVAGIEMANVVMRAGSSSTTGSMLFFTRSTGINTANLVNDGDFATSSGSVNMYANSMRIPGLPVSTNDTYPDGDRYKMLMVDTQDNNRIWATVSQGGGGAGSNIRVSTSPPSGTGYDVWYQYA